MLTSAIPIGLTILLSIPLAATSDQPARGIREQLREFQRRPSRIRQILPTRVQPAGESISAPLEIRPRENPEATREVAAPSPVRLLERSTIVVRLQHAPATDIAGVIREWLKNEQAESDRPKVTVAVDAISNSLLLRGTAEQLNDIQAIVKELDQPLRQIRLRSLLAELSLPEAPRPGVGSITQEVVEADLDKVIADLQQRGELRLLARPELLVTDNQPAFLQLGQRIPRVTGTSVSGRGMTNSVTMENVGTILGVTGRVSDDQSVTLEVDLEASHLGPENEGVTIAAPADQEALRTPATHTISLQTTVALKSGQTVLIGGMVYRSATGWREVILLLRADVTP
jgi:type II secretory pathway component GspD/PulD (secretin)